MLRKRWLTLGALALLGGGAALRMPIDIFPEINIPVVSVVWTYNGMSAQDIQDRILSLHERQLALGLRPLCLAGIALLGRASVGGHSG